MLVHESVDNFCVIRLCPFEQFQVRVQLVHQLSDLFIQTRLRRAPGGGSRLHLRFVRGPHRCQLLLRLQLRVLVELDPLGQLILQTFQFRLQSLFQLVHLDVHPVHLRSVRLRHRLHFGRMSSGHGLNCRRFFRQLRFEISLHRFECDSRFSQLNVHSSHIARMFGVGDNHLLLVLGLNFL